MDATEVDKAEFYLNPSDQPGIHKKIFLNMLCQEMVMHLQNSQVLEKKCNITIINTYL